MGDRKPTRRDVSVAASKVSGFSRQTLEGLGYDIRWSKNDALRIIRTRIAMVDVMLRHGYSYSEIGYRMGQRSNSDAENLYLSINVYNRKVPDGEDNCDAISLLIRRELERRPTLSVYDYPLEWSRTSDRSSEGTQSHVV